MEPPESPGASADIRVVADVRNTLGEGVAWIADTERAWWVDIEEATLWSCRLDGSELASWVTPGPPSFVAQATPGSDFIIPIGTAIYRFDTHLERFEHLLDFEESGLNVRANDGSFGPDGLLWVGTMDTAGQRRVGSLFAIDVFAGQIHRVLTGLGIPNTVSWSPTGLVLYMADSMDGTMSEYSIDRDHLTVTSQRKIYATELPATPDGSAWDETGGLWTAIWDGWAIRHYDPTKGRTEEFSVPVQRPTCCVIVPGEQPTLLVTSARTGLESDRLDKQPLAGALLALDLPV